MNFQEIDLEQQLIGYMILDPRIIDVHGSTLDIEYFGYEKSRIIFQALVDMRRDEKKISIPTIEVHLRQAFNYEKSDSLIAWLRTVDDGAFQFLPVIDENDITQLFDNFRMRAKAHLALSELDRIHPDKGDTKQNIRDPEKWLERASEIVTTARNTAMLRDTVDIRQQCEQHKNDLDQRKTDKGIIGLSTGFQRLDKYLHGLRNGHLIIVAGRPGTGKTALSIQIADTITQQCKRVLFLSLEMGADELITRMISQRTGISSSRLQTGDLEKTDIKRYHEALDSISDSNLIIRDTLKPDWKHIQQAIHNELFRNDGNVDLIALDYVQLIRTKTDARYLYIGEIARECKLLAKQYKLPFMLLSQLSREADGQSPKLCHLRESGDLEQNADSVILMYRPGMYTKDAPETECQLKLPKNRHGPTGTITVKFVPELTLFTDKINSKKPGDDDVSTNG